MALNAAALNVMASALAGAATHASLHSADPGVSGANETSDARQAISWSAPIDGDLTLSTPENFTGPSNGACPYVGLWSAVSGGTFYGAFALAGDQTFNTAGEYGLDDLDLNGAAIDA